LGKILAEEFIGLIKSRVHWADLHEYRPRPTNLNLEVASIAEILNSPMSEDNTIS